MSYFRVMLIDDEIWALKGLEKIVDWELYGFTIAAECRNGNEALECLEREQIDLIFTDLSMDVMGGKEFIRQVRDMGYEAEIVIVSAFSDFEAARDGIRLRIFDYVLKPYDQEEIKSLLRRLEKYMLEKKASEKTLTLDRDFIVTDKMLEELREQIGGTNPYVFLRPKEMDKYSYEQRKNLFRSCSAGEMVVWRMGDEAEGLIFATNTPIEGILSDTERIGISMTAEILEDLKTLIFEAGFSCFMKQAFSRDPICQCMQKYIIYNVTRNVTLEEIADSVYLSRSYASSYYSKTAGMSLGEFQKKARMFLACDMLVNTEQAVSEIADYLGFDDPSYFSKVFKSEFGCMPKEYRKKALIN